LSRAAERSAFKAAAEAAVALGVMVDRVRTSWLRLTTRLLDLLPSIGKGEFRPIGDEDVDMGGETSGSLSLSRRRARISTFAELSRIPSWMLLIVRPIISREGALKERFG
jgi:hypothetical protein